MLSDYPAESLIKESSRKATQAFWFSEKRIKSNYHRFLKGVPGLKIFYPPKVNANADILKLLSKEGSNFDAASLGEIRLLSHLKISPDRIIFTTPIKPINEIHAAYKKGVRVFVADSLMEIDKIAKAAPGSKVLVRLQTSNKGSQWPLSRRFGVPTKQAAQLLQHISDWKLVPYGLCFHVGSQCTNVQNWRDAIRHCFKVMKEFEKKGGVELQVLDLGGGFPVCSTKPVPSLENIFDVIKHEVARLGGQ